MNNNPDKKPNIFVLIPALNEEKSIGSVIDDIPNDMVREIIVIDNEDKRDRQKKLCPSGKVKLE